MLFLTVSKQQAAKRGDGDKDGADAIKAEGKPARGGEEQEPGLCSGSKKVSLTLQKRIRLKAHSGEERI